MFCYNIRTSEGLKSAEWGCIRTATSVFGQSGWCGCAGLPTAVESPRFAKVALLPFGTEIRCD